MKIQPLTCRDGREHGGWTRMNTDFQFQRFSICPLFKLSDFSVSAFLLNARATRNRIVFIISWCLKCPERTTEISQVLARRAEAVRRRRRGYAGKQSHKTLPL